MQYFETSIPGVYRICLQKNEDERGFFARTFCREEFQAHGLVAAFDQCNISLNTRCGILRGLHYQVPPFSETKLVRCSRGALYDVVLDIRRNSPTFGRWLALELSAANSDMVYIPAGCAHGYQTLLDDTEITYQVAGAYRPEATRGIRWDDPAFQIQWPILPPVCMSDKDRTCPDFK